MNNNIIEAIQKRLGYPPLKKVDPNIQETTGNLQSSIEEKLGQSAIPVVLAGFFHLSRTEDGCNAIIRSNKEMSWLPKLFGDHETLSVEKVAQYAHVSNEEARIDMEQAAREAYRLLMVTAGEKRSPEKIKTYLSNQRHTILVYLPAALQLGYLLNENAMDDRTNKMEGPVSSFMHTIENKLSGGGN
jgi:hypothetical protein